MIFKDLFSARAPDYARFRPDYPSSLFAWLAARAPTRGLALDVGTGSGQAAVALAPHFARVIAVEPSEAQLASATAAPGVEYRRGSAEATGVDGASVDLLTVAQAFHWFDQPAFFAEARRVVRPGGCLAVWCYAVAAISPEVDPLVHEVYETRLGPYWEPERRLVEDGYRSVPVPFDELEVPTFDLRLDWTLDQLVGYLGTWSPLKRYIEEHGENPIEAILPRLQRAWGAPSTRPVVWPLSVRAFRL